MSTQHKPEVALFIRGKNKVGCMKWKTEITFTIKKTGKKSWIFVSVVTEHKVEQKPWFWEVWKSKCTKILMSIPICAPNKIIMLIFFQ